MASVVGTQEGVATESETLQQRPETANCAGVVTVEFVCDCAYHTTGTAGGRQTAAGWIVHTVKETLVETRRGLRNTFGKLGTRTSRSLIGRSRVELLRAYSDHLWRWDQLLTSSVLRRLTWLLCGLRSGSLALLSDGLSSLGRLPMFLDHERLSDGPGRSRGRRRLNELGQLRLVQWGSVVLLFASKSKRLRNRTVSSMPLDGSLTVITAGDIQVVSREFHVTSECSIEGEQILSHLLFLLFLLFLLVVGLRITVLLLWRRKLLIGRKRRVLSKQHVGLLVVAHDDK
mmetsp:Transcript_11035/g.33789  ORF Transcript_11035/g.33789 Transcript_11035/m.33789 type:complete len:287 (-) Transcript_11035:186-1046(-)